MSTYPERLEAIGIQLITPFTTAKAKHSMMCLNCDHVWSATPIAKLQAFKKRGTNGCPECTTIAKYATERAAFIAKIEERFEILSEYDGQQNTASWIIVRNKSCGHEFETSPGNLVHKHVECAICAGAIRSDALARSHNR